jgi:arylsulfatase A-like enzyme
MFSAIFPPQHWATSETLMLTEEVVTLAEQLQAAGYRTGAITDSLLVTYRSGLHQGFEYWDEYEQEPDLPSMLDRVEDFLRADDGRPTFLFVQSYRVHQPYRVSALTREEYGDRMTFVDDGDALQKRAIALAEMNERDESQQSELEESVRTMRDMYLGAVVDLDRGFEQFLELLGEVGHDDSYLIFTSDHGEAFGEHGVLDHGTAVWEEHIRIPLLIRGPGLEPRDVPEGASLVDLPHTIAELLDVPPSLDWLGTSLLDLQEDRPVFSFVSGRCEEHTGSVAVVHGDGKLIAAAEVGATELGEVVEVYDLGTDPGEQDNLRDHTPPWAGALEDAIRPEAIELLTPLFEQSTGQMSEEHLQRLRDVGYADF